MGTSANRTMSRRKDFRGSRRIPTVDFPKRGFFSLAVAKGASKDTDLDRYNSRSHVSAKVYHASQPNGANGKNKQDVGRLVAKADCVENASE